MQCSEKDGGWGHGEGHVNYTMHFYAEFSKPFVRFGVWDKEQVLPERREYEGRDLGFYTEFPTRAGEQVLLRTGISFVSVAGAKANLQHDIPDWNFDKVHQQARQLWATALDSLQIEGGAEAQKQIFFTAMYHALLDPRSATDVDGQYFGADNKPHQARDFTYRTVFSGWDVFRSEFPLLTLIAPQVVNDEVGSLVELADQSGRKYFERWELLNAYTACMLGHPAVCVLGEAYLKGIRNYDVAKAYEFTKNSLAMTEHKEGYYPNSLSWTLEQAYADYCAGRLAEALGKPDDARDFFRRSMNYRNVYDPSVHNMRSRKADGSWEKWQGKTVAGFLGGQGCTESNPWQQGWFVPHDVQGLI